MRRDYIDSSVYLGMVFDESDSSWEYLRLVGYKGRSKGIISEYVIGEVFNHLLTDIVDENPALALENKKYAFELIDDVIAVKEQEGDLRIVPFAAGFDQALFDSIRSVDRAVSFDDMLHLCTAIEVGCDAFVTLDSFLLEASVLQRFLVGEYGLRILRAYS